MNAVALEPAVPQDLPVLQPGQSMLDPGSSRAVDCVLCFLLWAEAALASSIAVRIEQAGALVAAVGDDRGSATGPVDAGLRERPAVVAAAEAAAGRLPRPGDCWRR